MPEAFTDPQKCPCCDNPWARATGDLFAQMCGECTTTTTTAAEKKPVEFGLSRTNMDLTTSPNDNFYQYANGTWMKENPIPAGYPNWNTFLALHVQSQERCQALLKQLLLLSEETTSDVVDKEEAYKVASFYQAAMEEEKIEQDGIAVPLKPILDQIEAIVAAKEKGDASKYAELLGQLDAEFGTCDSFFNTILLI